MIHLNIFNRRSLFLIRNVCLTLSLVKVSTMAEVHISLITIRICGIPITDRDITCILPKVETASRRFTKGSQKVRKNSILRCLISKKKEKSFGSVHSTQRPISGPRFSSKDKTWTITIKISFAIDSINMLRLRANTFKVWKLWRIMLNSESALSIQRELRQAEAGLPKRRQSMALSLACINITKLNRERSCARKPYTISNSKKIIHFNPIESPSRKILAKPEKIRSREQRGCIKSGSSAKRKWRKRGKKSRKKRSRWRECSSAILSSNSQENLILALSVLSFLETWQMLSLQIMEARDA
jgi:hypothetical protein